jgi:cytochrome c553
MAVVAPRREHASHRTRRVILGSLLLAAFALNALAADPAFEVPEWAYPGYTNPPAPGTQPDGVVRHHVPDSDVTFTQAQLSDMFVAPDWFPGRHPAMPEPVARGRQPDAMACAYCHLPDGTGRPENAALAGLPADYIRAQVADIRHGLRTRAWTHPSRPSSAMQQVAEAATEAEVAAAADYFSRLPMRRKIEVVESARIPVTEQERYIYVAVEGAGDEPLGQRLIEMPLDPARHELRDPYVTYRVYVPPGSLERGRLLATTTRQDGTKIACDTCHGPLLRGTDVFPPLAGRSPSYLLRQLLSFKVGTRAAPAGAAMRSVVDHLDLDDMIAAAAYAGSLEP